MKAIDLMVGDWVRIAPYDIIDQVDCLLTEYAVTSHGDSCGQYDYKDIEPIPLTPEILEKNGFGFIDTSNSEYSSIWTGWWILEGLELGCCDNSKFPIFFNIADTNVKVNYVHELQHALKFCKIDKKIVL